MTSQIETVSRSMIAAGRQSPATPLIPALSGCPDCRTMRVIASPAPLGSCPDCGAALEVLSDRHIAAAAPFALVA